jgi:hypothetical protein
LLIHFTFEEIDTNRRKTRDEIEMENISRSVYKIITPMMR